MIYGLKNTSIPIFSSYRAIFCLDEQQPTAVYKKDSVIIKEHLTGEIKINLRGHYLDYKVLPERPKKEIDIKGLSPNALLGINLEI